MSQRTIYIPDDLEKKIVQKSKKEEKSLSAYVVDLIRKDIEPQTAQSEWEQYLFGAREPLSDDFPDDIEDSIDEGGHVSFDDDEDEKSK